MKFVSFEPGETQCFVWVHSPDVFTTELLTWKDLCEGIKTQQHQTPAEFQVIRFRDSSLVNNMPHLLTPGTILVLEDTRSIECVPSSEAREIWMGNNYENIRWGHSILRWNGQYLSWVGASTASVQSAKQHWDTVNCHTPGEIVQSIISGFTSKPSRMRNKRSALKKGGARSLLQDVERLQKTVGELQASIDAKDATIANLYEQLQEVTTENHALRSSQIICAIPPLHIPSLDPQHLSVESNSRLLDVPATDHCFSRRLPSSLIPTVRRLS